MPHWAFSSFGERGLLFSYSAWASGFPDSSVDKESTCNAGDPSSIPGLGISAGEGIDYPTPVFLGFPFGSAGKESTCNVGDLGSIPGFGRSPGEGKGYPLQHSGLENSTDCTIHGVPNSWTRQSNLHFTALLLQSTGSRACRLISRSLWAQLPQGMWNPPSCPCSVALCNSRDCSVIGLPVLHSLLKFFLVHVHWIGDAIQPSHPLSPPSPPALNLSQNKGLSQCLGSLHQVARVWEFIPRPGIKVLSPTLAGELLTTGPPEKSRELDLERWVEFGELQVRRKE